MKWFGVVVALLLMFVGRANADGTVVVFAGDSIMAGTTGSGIAPAVVSALPGLTFYDTSMAVAGANLYDVKQSMLIHPNGIDAADAVSGATRHIFFDNSGTNSVRG